MGAVATTPVEWRVAGGHVRLDRPVVVGIVNVTPDSFYDGGRHADVAAAIEHGHRLIEDGADVLDVGGESTRPGAAPVTEAEEVRRVVPVVQALHERWPHVPVSVDTLKHTVAREALAAGAAALNDVSGLRLEPRLAEAAAAAGAGLILMHSRGGVADMARYELAGYDDVVADVRHALAAAVAAARAVGVPDDALVVDPGLGFSKRTEHSLALLAGLRHIAGLGLPVLVGPSRKRFIGEVGGGLPPEQRLEGTLAACVVALLHGAVMFRVHDAGPARRALDLAAAVLATDPAPAR